MATNHRGAPVGNPNTSHGGHRPTPRLARIVQASMGMRTDSGTPEANSVIEAHRASGGDASWVTDPVEATKGLVWASQAQAAQADKNRRMYPYLDTMDTGLDVEIEKATSAYDVNNEVAQAGGTRALIGSAFKNRKRLKEAADQREQEYYDI